jgi:virulence factor Mce-like protein
MPKGNLSPARIATIALFALSCFGLLLFLWIAFGGSSPLKPKGYRFEASFDDAATLAVQADVRAAGVSIGKVVSKRRDPAGNRTLATIELEPDFAPLRRDARAVLRQKTLLGETFVEVTTGTKRAPAIPEGGRLADARVAPAVEFDELLRIFDEPTREAFREWQASTAESSGGEGERVNAVLGQLPGFTGNARDVVDVLERRRDGLRQLVSGTASTFEALGRNEAALQETITSGRTTLETLAGRREALAESFRIFPTFLRESRATLGRLETFSRSATPLVRDLQPVLADARPTLRDVGALSPDLERLLGDLRPLIRAGREGLPALSSTLDGLSPTLRELGPVLQQLNPVLEFAELYQTNVTDFIEIGASALNIDLADRPGTNGHALPQLITAGSQTLPWANRSPDNRGSTYLPPGAYYDNRFKEVFSLPSFDCNHVGVKGPTDTPSCYVQNDVNFQGRMTRFPQVRPAAAGGITGTPRGKATPLQPDNRG